MSETIHQQINAIIQNIREHPVHMTNMIHRMQRLREKIQAGELAPPAQFGFDERAFFDENEEITVYLDFISPIFPSKEGDSFENRYQLAKKFLHQHNFFELYYVYSGECCCFINQKEYRLKPGSICVLNTQQSHSVLLVDETTNLINILVKRSTFTDKILSMLDSNDMFYQFFTRSLYDPSPIPDFIKFDVTNNSHIEFYLLRLLQEYMEKQRLNQSMMCYMLCSIMVELSRQYEKQLKSAKQKESLQIFDVLAYINSHFLTVTLKELSEQFHYSQNYISQFILKQTGKKFSETVNHLKLRKAQELLCNSDLDIETIAANLGYSDRNGFEKAFKKAFQITPKQYASWKKDNMAIPSMKQENGKISLL